MFTASTALAVAIGGALGALSRVGLTEWWGDDPLAWGTLLATLAVNTLGSVGLGLMRRPQAMKPPAWLQAGASIGFLGSFTTWSAVMVHSALLADDRQLPLALSYLVATVGLGILGAWWGLRSEPRGTRGAQS